MEITHAATALLPLAYALRRYYRFITTADRRENAATTNISGLMSPANISHYLRI